MPFPHLIIKFATGRIFINKNSPTVRFPHEELNSPRVAPLSPYLPISLSPYLPISLSPYLPISLHPYRVHLIFVKKKGSVGSVGIFFIGINVYKNNTQVIR
ncbi:MAG: hypothetical protein F6K56_26080 [Moorea sp. SIO3G5]|nr:hypothetical protein [Moorena sp. SIO3G5]